MRLTTILCLLLCSCQAEKKQSKPKEQINIFGTWGITKYEETQYDTYYDHTTTITTNAGFLIINPKYRNIRLHVMRVINNKAKTIFLLEDKFYLSYKLKYIIIYPKHEFQFKYHKDKLKLTTTFRKKDKEITIHIELER